MHSTDVLVLGGSVRAVAAALTAARAGRSVELAAPRLYLGDDMIGTLQLWLRDGERAEGELSTAIFADGSPTTPLRVKKVLAQALVDANVEIRLGCLPVGITRNAADARITGVDLAARGGVFHVSCGAVIDATDAALAAELAGAPFRPRREPAAPPRRVQVARADASAPAADCRIPFEDVVYLEYALDAIPDEPESPASFAEAEQAARDHTAFPGALRGSERLYRVPNRVHAGASSPPGLFVLGPCAETDPAQAEALLRPSTAEAAGRECGQQTAHTVPNTAPHTHPLTTTPTAKHSHAHKPTNSPPSRPEFELSALPFLGHWDVLVIGGGTAGACAAIAAARRGARVLVTEFQEALGGIGTVGLIGIPYHGLRKGFACEVPFPGNGFTVEDKMEWYRREIRRAGGDIWLGALAFDALQENGRVTGVALATPVGCGTVSGNVVIDSTGNADIAIAAGADWRYGDHPMDIAMQGAGLSVRDAASSPANSDFLLVDDADPVDVSRAVVGAHLAMDVQCYDTVPIPLTRERRTVVGEHELSYLDQIAGRTYADSVVLSASDYDSHGYPSLPYFAMLPHDADSRNANHPAPGGECHTPYRCLLPKGLDGILVAGLGISMHRDAAALVRMQHDMHNQGYAMGVAATMIAKSGGKTRDLDIAALQRHLVSIGNLPPDVLEHEDQPSASETALREAVRALGLAANPTEAGRPLALILAHPEQSHPLIADEFANSADDRKLYLARILGFLGDRRAVPPLLEALADVRQWDPKIFQGIMAEYAHLPTPVDTLVMALGWTKDPRAVPQILRMLTMLDGASPLSHHRAVALALERIGAAAAARPLHDLLQKPGMRGHALTRIVPLPDQPPDQRRRLGALREIVLARALLRCGDCNQLAKTILQEYRHDLRPLFHRHARACLPS